MEKSKTRINQSLLLTLILMVAAFWVVPSAAIAQEMVEDPATGQTWTKPEYGGTLTQAVTVFPPSTDPSIGGILAGRLT